MSRSLLVAGLSMLFVGCTVLFPLDDLEGVARLEDGGLESGTDAGVADAGRQVDAGTPEDAGAQRDAGEGDAGEGDAGFSTDAGSHDAGEVEIDAGTPDSGAPDAGTFCDSQPNATFCSDFDRSTDLLADGWTDYGGPPTALATMLHETTDVHSPPGAARSAITAVPAKVTAGRNLYATLNSNPAGRRYRFRLMLPAGVPTGESFVVCSMNSGMQYVSMTVSTNEIGLYSDTGSHVEPFVLPSGFNEIEIHLGPVNTTLLVNSATVAMPPSLHQFPLGPSTFSVGLPFVEGPSSAFTTIVDDVVITDDP